MLVFRLCISVLLLQTNAIQRPINLIMNVKSDGETEKKRKKITIPSLCTLTNGHDNRNWIYRSIHRQTGWDGGGGGGKGAREGEKKHPTNSAVDILDF